MHIHIRLHFWVNTYHRGMVNSSRLHIHTNFVLPWWRHQMEIFSALLAQSPVNSPHGGQWRGAFMFSLIYSWTNGWVNNPDAGDLRCYCAHYDVTVMDFNIWKPRLHDYVRLVDTDLTKYLRSKMYVIPNSTRETLHMERWRLRVAMKLTKPLPHGWAMGHPVWISWK